MGLFPEKEQQIKEHTEIIETSFSKYGLKVQGISIHFEEMIGGSGIKFFVEISSEGELQIPEVLMDVKVNVYDADGNLISMGSSALDLEMFSGFNTLDIAVFDESIHERAASAKIYFAT